MRSTLIFALAALVPALVPACGPAASTDEGADEPVRDPSWPEDTILVVGDEPVTASEVQAWVPTIAAVHRSKSEADHIRQALTNIVLHRAIGRQLAPDARERARARSETWLATLEAGDDLPAEGPQVARLHGSWTDGAVDIGLDRWGMARTLEPGVWTAFETIGGYTVMRVVSKPSDEQWHPNVPVTIEQVTDYYLDPSSAKIEIDSVLDTGLEIRVIDPAWANYLPVHYLHRTSTDGRE